MLAENRELLVLLLGDSGLLVEEAENGQVGVEMARRSAFDLILMDVQMPELDGMEATQRIREMQERGELAHLSRSRIPIIAMTASAFEEDRQNSLKAGMDDFVVKPIRARDISVAFRRIKPLLLA